MAGKRAVSSQKALTISFLVDVLDIVSSILVSILSGSVIMLSEALQGTADAINSGFLLIGYHRAKKKASAGFQFGYGKEVYFWTIISSLIMFTVTATISVLIGYHRWLNPQIIHNKILMLASLLLALTTNSYAFWLSVKRLYKNTDITNIWRSFKSSSLIEIKTSFVLDLMGAMSSLLGLIAFTIFSLTGNYRFDGIGAMMIGLLIAIMAILLLTELRTFVAGKSADSETIEMIKKIALAAPGVKSISDLRTMYQGSEKLIINLDILINDSDSAETAGEIIDKIKEKIKDEIKETYYIQIELDN